MTRTIALLLLVSLMAVLLLGCGRYGKPLRAWEVDRASDPTAHELESCEDPEHDHEKTP